MLSCETSEVPVAAHFREVTKMVDGEGRAWVRGVGRTGHRRSCRTWWRSGGGIGVVHSRRFSERRHNPC
nr:MAG TPA: hypothetical protein [Caudoviricetes sp.]